MRGWGVSKAVAGWLRDSQNRGMHGGGLLLRHGHARSVMLTKTVGLQGGCMRRVPYSLDPDEQLSHNAINLLLESYR